MFMWDLNLPSCFQAFTTSPIWISTGDQQKCYRREEWWMSPSPFTLQLPRYKGGSCINRFFVWGHPTKQSLTFPLRRNSRLQSNVAEGWGYFPLMRVRVMLELSLPQLPHPPHQSQLCPAWQLGPPRFTAASPAAASPLGLSLPLSASTFWALGLLLGTISVAESILFAGGEGGHLPDWHFHIKYYFLRAHFELEDIRLDVAELCVLFQSAAVCKAFKGKNAVGFDPW